MADTQHPDHPPVVSLRLSYLRLRLMLWHAKTYTGSIRHDLGMIRYAFRLEGSRVTHDCKVAVDHIEDHGEGNYVLMGTVASSIPTTWVGREVQLHYQSAAKQADVVLYGPRP